MSLTEELEMIFRETKLVLLSADLAGYARATANLDALAVAAFLDEWYRRCAATISEGGGRIVKYIGDGCLATFPDDRCVDAVDAAASLQRAIDDVRSRHRLKVELPNDRRGNWRKNRPPATYTLAR